MIVVRVAAVDRNTFIDRDDRFFGCTGEITGISGQFVTVRITHDKRGNKIDDRHTHLFLPGELRQF